MGIVEWLIAMIMKAAWRIACALFPRAEPEPRDDYPPPPEGFGGGESLEVKPSLLPDAGMGLFTTKKHAALEVLCLYTGERLTFWDQLRSRHVEYFADTAAGIICNRKYLNIKGRYINHHFDADRRNVAFLTYPDATILPGRCLLVLSLREIEAGEELYTNYGEAYWTMQ
jgi:hypothetical protein